ncbi:hypothetical protein CASFOL_039162 [Castilleja foliolosa]|uniref:Uncharacterized protein n=1 Tax=Castilleja foliolosa TaxID=1961234 RepID=A0ABD3BH83_9LAMI
MCFPALGVGFSGSLASKHPKLGEHRFHVSTRTSDNLWASTVTLSKGLRTREEEDNVSSRFLLKAIAYASKAMASFVCGLTDSEIPEDFEMQFDEDRELEQLIGGQICFKAEKKIIFRYVGLPRIFAYILAIKWGERKRRQRSHCR